MRKFIVNFACCDPSKTEHECTAKSGGGGGGGWWWWLVVMVGGGGGGGGGGGESDSNSRSNEMHFWNRQY